MQTVLLIVALSVDVFLASMACGTERIYIEKKTALCISIICSGVLFLSLLLGGFLCGVIQEKYTTRLCFVVFLCIGIFKLTEYGIKRYIKKYKFLCKRVKITFSQLNFILSIYNNPVMADKDKSSSMSVSEGIFFALAMSLDGFFAGLGAAFLKTSLIGIIILNLLVSLVAVCLGNVLGRRAAAAKEWDFSWIGGVLFVALAISKIV